MVSAPKSSVLCLVGSCCVLACLTRLRQSAAEKAELLTRQPGGPRVGGQSGEGGEPATGTVGKARKPHTRQPGGPRVGGQSGRPAGTHTQEGEAGKPHARQPGGPRVGGQGGQ